MSKLPKRILIVEDEWFIASEYERVLGDAGYGIVGIAVSCAEAAEFCEQHHPSFIIMDVRMRGTRDGIDCAREVYRRWGIRSVFITAHGDAAMRRRAEDANALGWIMKPVLPSELVAKIAALLPSD